MPHAGQEGACLYPQHEIESKAACKMESPRTKHRLKVPVFTISRNLSQAQPHLHRGINAFSQSLPGKKTGFGRGQTLLLILKTEGSGRKLVSFPEGRVWIWTRACEEWSEQVGWLVCSAPHHRWEESSSLMLTMPFSFQVIWLHCLQRGMQIRGGWNAFPWPRVFSKSCLLFRKSPEQLASLNCGTSRRVLNKN